MNAIISNVKKESLLGGTGCSQPALPPHHQLLHNWLQSLLKIHIPTQPICPHHNAPFDYLTHTFFEPSKDVIVWAPRGGGKTRLAAIATLLDLLHKPDCHIRILGGSLEQSLRMWEHLEPDIRLIAPAWIDKSRKAGRIQLNLSSAAILPQSERAVRGLRIQKLRCDEVELFDPKVWQAAQLITKSHTQVGWAPPTTPA